jgi:hypothetical protein
LLKPSKVVPDPRKIKAISAENDVRAALTNWIEQCGGSVYWGEKVEGYDQEIFTVKSRGVSGWGNDSHRPDMLIDISDRIIVVEVKTGDKYGQIADGIYQTFGYWNKYHRNRLMYETNDGVYDPDSFALATRYSPFGHTYPSEHEFYYSNGEMYGVNEQVPQFEANMSSVSVRALWRFAQSEAQDNISAGIGLMLSDVLEEIPEFDTTADAFDMVRASEIEKQGQPAVFHWKADQEWLTF